jgi:hypothetical protein
MTYTGSCHCAAVQVTMDHTPTDAGSCNCSICRRTGALWAYCSPTKVSVSGQGVGYVQGDGSLTLWHCGTCGVTTHWTAMDLSLDRMGINLRLFEPSLWHTLPVRLIDGASW